MLDLTSTIYTTFGPVQIVSAKTKCMKESSPRDRIRQIRKVIFLFFCPYPVAVPTCDVMLWMIIKTHTTKRVASGRSRRHRHYFIDLRMTWKVDFLLHFVPAGIPKPSRIGAIVRRLLAILLRIPKMAFGRSRRHRHYFYIDLRTS